MIYEGVYFSVDLVLSVVAVLIVPGGFKGGRVSIYWTMISTTLGRTRRSLTCVCWETGSPCRRLISLTGPPSSRFRSLDREGRDLRYISPSPAFWHMGARLFTSWEASGSLFCWKRIDGVLFRTIRMESSFIAHCKHFYFISIVDYIIWSCRL